MRVVLIHNPKAGDDKQPSADELLLLLRGAGYETIYRSAKEEGWEAVLDEPEDFVIAAGGDGTIGKVAKQLAGRGTPLAVLPMGTANNISKSLGLSDQPLEQLIQGWPTATRMRFDVGIVTGPWGATPFVEGFGFGLVAEMMHYLDATDNAAIAGLHAGEKVAAVVALFQEHLHRATANRLTATLDGEDISGDYILIEALNIAHVGPNLHLTRHADPGDSLLDVILVTEQERDTLSTYLGQLLESNTPHPARLPTRHGQRLQIEWASSAIHIDDETRLSTASEPQPATIRVEAAHSYVDFLMPA